VKLEGKTALVTGGAKRVGRAITLELANAGCDVAIHHLQARSEAVALAEQVEERGGRALAIAGDLNEPAQWPLIVRKVRDGLGRLDILVNNASIFLTRQPDTLDGFDPELWDAMLRVNLTATVGLCHHARPALQAGGGVVVNLCDISAERPWPDHLAYCVSKAGLAAATQALARAMAPDVRVFGLAPGIAVFPDEYPPELRDSLTRRVPLGRAGTPEEIATLTRVLIESGDYLTGQIIRFDGGRSLV
jgi:pteridine reductase